MSFERSPLDISHSCSALGNTLLACTRNDGDAEPLRGHRRLDAVDVSNASTERVQEVADPNHCSLDHRPRELAVLHLAVGVCIL